MPPPAHRERAKNHRVPGAMLSQGGWLSARFTLRSRDVPALLCARGSAVSHAALRPWGRQGGPAAAPPRRRRQPRPGAPWPVAEGGLTIPGARHARWRAVAQEAHGLESLGQRRRPQHAAPPCWRTGLTGGQAGPRGSRTAPVKSERAATRERLPGGAHRPRRSLQTRCEPSPRPPRHRERRRPGGPSAGHAPRCGAASGPLAQPCRPSRPRRAAPEYRQARRQRGARWAARTGPERAASRGGRASERQPLA